MATKRKKRRDWEIRMEKKKQERALKKRRRTNGINRKQNIRRNAEKRKGYSNSFEVNREKTRRKHRSHMEPVKVRAVKDSSQTKPTNILTRIIQAVGRFISRIIPKGRGKTYESIGEVRV